MKHNGLRGWITMPTLAFSALVTLSTQFMLGIYATFFVELPESGNRWLIASQGILGIHIIIGLLLLALSVWLLVLAIRRLNAYWITASLVGLAGLVLAWWFGASFVTKDSDISSFLMASGFSVALVAYSWGLWSEVRGLSKR